MDTASSAATEAENNPVYSFLCYESMDGDVRTHENEDAISVLCPAVSHLIIFFLCNLRIHGKDGP